MRNAFLILLLVITWNSLSAQVYWPVTHLSGTQSISGVNVNVQSINNASTTTFCGIGPYWIGQSINAYEFSLSKRIYKFRVILTAINIGELISLYTNNTKYNINISELFSYTGSCTAGTGVISNGDLTVTTTSNGGNTSSNALLDITLANPSDTIRVQHANGAANGTTFAFFIVADSVLYLDKLSDDTLCVGDTLKVNYAVTDTFNTNNTFTAILSGPTGSFATPTTIGSTNGRISGIFSWVVPSTIPAGYGYRIRLLSTSPVRQYDLPKDIVIGNVKVTKPVASNNGTICNGQTLNLFSSTSTTGVYYRWRGPDNFTSSLQNPFVSPAFPANSGNYEVTAWLYGCSASDTTMAGVASATNIPGLMATISAPVCTGDTLKLFGASNLPGITYSWTGPNNFSANIQNPVIPLTTASMSGDYIVKGDNGICSGKDTITVAIKPTPANFIATYNTPVCIEQPVNFSATSTSAGVTYSWTGPNSFAYSGANPFIGSAASLHNGNYIATATLNGCPLKDTLTLVVKPLPAKPVAGADVVLCSDDTLHLSATTTTTGATYNWTGPNSFTAAASDTSVGNTTTFMSGNYTVSVTADGCSNTDTVNVTVKQSPVVTTTLSNSPICDGHTLAATVGTSTTGAAYTWRGPNSFSANTQNISISNSTLTHTGWYVATVNLNGCGFIDSTYAIVNPIPAKPVITYNNPLCIGESLNLTTNVATGASYKWIGPGNFTSLLPNAQRSNMQYVDTGKYLLDVTVNGCTSPQAEIPVKINPLPFVVAFTGQDTICQGQPAVFTAIPSNQGGTPQYQWYVNGTIAGSGTLFSTATLSDGDIVRCDMTEFTKCHQSYTDTGNDISITVLPWKIPSVTFTANPNRPLQLNEYVKFTAIPKDAGLLPGYQWKRNGQDVQGATGSVWSANTLNDNDEINVVLTSNYRCPQPTTATAAGVKIRVLSGIGTIVGESQFKVYPNPGSDYVIFETAGIYDAELIIINVNGQKVLNTTIKGKTTWKTENVSSGIYLYRIRVHGQVITTGRVTISR